MTMEMSAHSLHLLREGELLKRTSNVVYDEIRGHGEESGNKGERRGCGGDGSIKTRGKTSTRTESQDVRRTALNVCVTEGSSDV